MLSSTPVLLLSAALVPLASAHISFWHNSMYGFNVTANTFAYDNRPVVPLMDMDFPIWWFHNFLDYPPNPGDVFELPVGTAVNTELSCDKGATSWYHSSSGGDAGYGSDWPCPGQSAKEFHTVDEADTKGCALAIADKTDARDVQPDDFTIFSVNQTCVWNLNTKFSVPAKMPACTGENCICAWFWQHSPDSGAEQMYMIGFKCKVTGATSTTPIGKQMLPRQCGPDKFTGRQSVPGNCTVGPKYPMYWLQKEGNNMFEGYYDVPTYNDKYGFNDGAQDDIFQDAYISSLGPSSPAATGSTGTPASVAGGSAQPTTSTAAPAATSAGSSSAPASASVPSSAVASVAAPATHVAVARCNTSAAQPTSGLEKRVMVKRHKHKKRHGLSF